MTATVPRQPPQARSSPAAGAGRRAWPQRARLGVLLGLAALLYLWNLGASGMANQYYAAAVQAGTQSWTALLFGSLDAGNVITVDKPPASLWLMALSGRIFGFSAWSMLVPQALAGVASVWLLYAAVHRWHGPAAGLLAGAVLALTPVAALMFRYNNPDALLTLLLVAAAYAGIRAIEHASTRWLLLAGTAIGLAFLTKMLQALLAVPALTLAFLVAAPVTVPRRLLGLATAGAAALVSAGWFVALAAVWPAASRPYIGGSTDGTVLDLALGYNGLGRIFGNDGPGGGSGGGGPGGGGPGGGPGGSAAFGGQPGLGRMFGAAFGSEVSWLLPAALVALAAGLWFTRRAPRTDRTRAALLLWGGWLLVTAAVFSLMAGVTHPYYAVALAPAIAALVGIGAVALWRGRSYAAARVWLAALVVVAAGWSVVLLTRDPGWLPWLRATIALAGLAAGSLIAVGAHQFRRAAAIVAVVALLAGLGGTAAYTVATAAVPHTGAVPASGPAPAANPVGRPLSTVDAELVEALRGTTETWAAASIGAQSAAGLQLASGRPVIAIGGFTGSDPAPTLEQFQAYVAQGRVHYFILDGGPAGTLGPVGRGGSEIAAWVRQNFTATTIGNRTVYDLT